MNQQSGQIRALIFDVDGTVYDSARLRRRLSIRLLRHFFLQPVSGVDTLRLLLAYRRAQELLRSRPLGGDDLEDAQLQLAAQMAGVGLDRARDAVCRWIEREPLLLLNRCLRAPLIPLLQQCLEKGIRLGVFSDYPAYPKLAALGLNQFFSVVACAQDPEIQRFKPDPTGLRFTLARLAVRPDEAVYIGDRADVDFPAASAAGMRCLILPQGGYSGWYHGDACLGELCDVVAGA